MNKLRVRVFDKEKGAFFSMVRSLFLENSPQGIYSVDVMSPLGDEKTVSYENLIFDFYVGRDDDHGNPIFSGDVVLVSDDGDTIIAGEVIYDKDRACYAIHRDYPNGEVSIPLYSLKGSEEVKVIGNIRENTLEEVIDTPREHEGQKNSTVPQEDQVEEDFMQFMTPETAKLSPIRSPERKIEKITVIFDRDLIDFIQEINSLLKKGWELQGDMMITECGYKYQMMVKRESGHE